MALTSNEFIVSGIVRQPDGVTLVTGDVEVVIENDGAVSNGGTGTSFTACAVVRDGEFTVSFTNLVPAVIPAAGEGDTLTIKLVDINTGLTLDINDNGDIVSEITRVLTAQDITAQQVEIALTLATQALIHSDVVLFRGDVFQSDGTSGIPLGAQLFIENTTKGTAFTIDILEDSEYSQEVVLPPGFDTNDFIRYSIRNIFTGATLPINIAGSEQLSLTIVLEDSDLIQLGRDPNQGELVQTFTLEQDFAGILLPPTTVTTQASDGQVQLNWTNVFNPDLTGFFVERAVTSSGPFYVISGTDPVDGTSYLDGATTPLFNGISYFYRIITVLDDNSESAPSSVVQGTPVVEDTDFMVRQLLDDEYVAGRDATIFFSALRRSFVPTVLEFAIKYETTTGAINEFIIAAPDIDEYNTYRQYSNTVTIPGDARRLVDLRIRSPFGHIYVVDNIVLNIRGNTVDATATQIIAPAYNSDNTQILIKNRLPGDLIILDIETSTPTRLADTGNGSVTDINSTIDAAEWADEDRSVVFTYFLGRNNLGNTLTELRTFDFVPNSGGLVTVPTPINDTAQAFCPKYFDPNQSVYFRRNPADNTASTLEFIGFRGDTMADPVAIEARGTVSFDLDPDGEIVFSTGSQVFVNSIDGGQSRQVLAEGSDTVQWGNINFIPGKLIAYQKSGLGSLEAEVYELTLLTDVGSDLLNRAEFVLDTTLYPDGPLDVLIKATDQSVNANMTTVTIRVTINNTFDVRPMFATSITNPGAFDPTTLTVDVNTEPVIEERTFTVIDSITNNCIAMSSGSTSANRGRIFFRDRITNQLLTTLFDTFTDRPDTQIAQTGLPTAVPLKLELSWATNNQNAEPGGTLNPCILTVDTGGVIRNIFLPEIAAAERNSLFLFVSEDGSTYYDPQLRCIARKATNDPLLDIAPELDPLPKYTNGTSVLLQWCRQPGSPRDLIAKYRILRSTDPLRDYKVIFTTLDNTTTEFRDPDLVNGTAYFYRIQAIDILGNVIDGSLGGVVEGTQTVFTVIDQTGALEAQGQIQVDLNIDDVVINEDMVLEPGTGKVFSERTTFSLNPDRNVDSPPITPSSQVFADYTFQKAKDVLLRLQPVVQVSSVLGEISGNFTQDRDYIFIEDDGIQSGSYRARDKIRFIRQERTVVEEELVRGESFHGSDALGSLFATKIESISMPVRITGEPATPIAGFLIQLTSSLPGLEVNGKRQVILEVFNVTNVTKNISYEVNDIIPNYNGNPAFLQLDILTNVARFPFPDPTDQITVDYSFLFVFPMDSYQLDRSMNSVRWVGMNAAQPLEGQRYLVTYNHLAPVPGERITIEYVTNNLIRTLQFGDIETGVQGVNLNRHICADVLARETNPVPVDMEFLIRLFDTADEGFVRNQILATISSMFDGKKLGEGVKISDISTAINNLVEVESLKLDPIERFGRTDTPHLLYIDVNDTAQFSVAPGRVEGEVTFFRMQRPETDILIPANTIVSNDFNIIDTVLLFEVTQTLNVPLNIVDNFYNAERDRYEFRVPVRALFEGAVSVGRGEINTVGGILANTLSVENESLIEGAVARQEVITGTNSLVLVPSNGQLIEILSVQNFSAANAERIPENVNFIKLEQTFITNPDGNDLARFADSSVVIDDAVVFATEIPFPGPLTEPGQYMINFEQGFIQTFTKTSAINNGEMIRYTYLEEYDLNFVEINEGRTAFILHGPSNAGRPLPKEGDTVQVDYRWDGNGIPLTYRLETFNNDRGILDFSFLLADDFNGPIFINGGEEMIENVATHPEPPFYAYDQQTRQLSIVGRTLTPGDEVTFRFSTPFGDIDLVQTAFDLQNRNDVSRFTFNVDFQTFSVQQIRFLEMGGDSVETSPGMIINAGLPKTSTRTVMVQLAAVNAKDMILSEDSLFRDRTEVDFEPFTTAKVFTLSSGDGTKTVYAKLRFANEAIQPALLSASIELDTTFNEGTFIFIEEEDFLYEAGTGILRIPTSFGQSDININDMQSVLINDIVLEFDVDRVKRTF